MTVFNQNISPVALPFGGSLENIARVILQFMRNFGWTIITVLLDSNTPNVYYARIARCLLEQSTAQGLQTFLVNFDSSQNLTLLDALRVIKSQSRGTISFNITVSLPFSPL